jgi:hypothetical protein
MRLRLVLTVSLTATCLVAGCGDQLGVDRSPDPRQAPAAWQRLPDPPLSARWGSVVAWTGSEVLAVGGDTRAPCPPNASCTGAEHYPRDGARLDPRAGIWQRMADAPSDVPAFAPNVLVAGTLYVEARGVLLAYEVARDAWSTIPTPAGFTDGQLVADADRLVVASGSDEQRIVPDRVYDPGTERWSTLPDDPIGPAFDRVLTAIPTGLVLTAHELVDDPGGDGPSLVLAARFDRATSTWTRLPDSDQLGGWAWTWTGRRLLDPTLGGGDGGAVGNYGRTIPFGGVLDPTTGQWSRLRHPPREAGHGWAVTALGGRFAAVGGWTYDDETASWAEVPRPEGAPAQPGAAVWAGDRLVVIGGVRDDRGYTVGALSPHAWISESGTTLGRPLL